jgi:hypothetical protein
VSEPTASERAYAKRVGLDPAAVANARDVLNTIALLPWPEPERVSLLARLARSGKADVGQALGRKALRITPLIGLDQLIPIDGLGEKRVAGLVRALGRVDVASFGPEANKIRDLLSTLAALRAEVDALRTELDHQHAQPLLPGDESQPNVMRVGDVASSVGSQSALAAQALQTSARGLRLAGVEMRVAGAAASVGNDLALDFAAPQGGSAVNLSFVSADAPAFKTGANVPDVLGYTPALARRKLTASGFVAKFSTLAAAHGIVAEQSPGAGAIAQQGSVVQLLIR